MITRDIPFTLNALAEVEFITCSTAAVVFASTANTVRSSAADLTAGVGVNGRIIDRLTDIMASRFYVAGPVAKFNSTRGSTESNRQIQIGVKLQHGTSSNGGDMTDYSTQNQPAYRTYFSTARTSDMANWDASNSTGAFYGSSDMAYYDLRGANRYLRVVAFAFKNRVTTESSGDENARLSADIVFFGGDRVPQIQTRAMDATSTSSST